MSPYDGGENRARYVFVRNIYIFDGVPTSDLIDLHEWARM